MCEVSFGLNWVVGMDGEDGTSPTGLGVLPPHLTPFQENDSKPAVSPWRFARLHIARFLSGLHKDSCSGSSSRG